MKVVIFAIDFVIGAAVGFFLYNQISAARLESKKQRMIESCTKELMEGGETNPLKVEYLCFSYIQK